MKICSLVLLTLLLVAPWTGSQGMSFRRFNSKCCYKGQFIQEEIPTRFIQSYWSTSPLCPRKAVRVQLPKRTVCVDPELDWFQQYLKSKTSM